MKCKRPGCDGTLCVMYRSKPETHLIGKSFTYQCDACGKLYVLLPRAIDPVEIEDGRDQVLLFLERCLEAAEHDFVACKRNRFLSMSRKPTKKQLLDHNIDHIKALIRKRKEDR